MYFSIHAACSLLGCIKNWITLKIIKYISQRTANIYADVMRGWVPIFTYRMYEQQQCWYWKPKKKQMTENFNQANIFVRTIEWEWKSFIEIPFNHGNMRKGDNGQINKHYLPLWQDIQWWIKHSYGDFVFENIFIWNICFGILYNLHIYLNITNFKRSHPIWNCANNNRKYNLHQPHRIK